MSPVVCVFPFKTVFDHVPHDDLELSPSSYSSLSSTGICYHAHFLILCKQKLFFLFSSHTQLSQGEIPIDKSQDCKSRGCTLITQQIHISQIWLNRMLVRPMLLLVMKLTVSRSRVTFQKPKPVPPCSTLKSTLLLAWFSLSLEAPKGLIYHTVNQRPGQRRLSTASLTALRKRRAGQTLDQSLATQEQQRTLPWYFTRCRRPRPKTHSYRFRLTGQGLCTYPCPCA